MNPFISWAALDHAGFAVLRLLLTALWQSSILLAAVGALSWVLRKRRASVRHGLWVGGLLLGPMLPLIAAAALRTGAPQVPVRLLPAYVEMPVLPPDSLEALSLAPAFERTSRVPAPISATVKQPLHVSLLAYPWALLLIAYAAGAVAFLAWIAVGRFRIRRWIRFARPLLDDRVVSAFQLAARTLGLRRGFLVLESERVPTSVSCGALHPVVLLPKGLAARLSDAELRALAIHELAHVRRNDALVLTVASLLRAVLFFHPLVWLAARRISALAEQAADDAVLEATGEPISYAKMLARLAEELPRRAMSAELTVGILISRSAFLHRVEAILSDRRENIRRFSRIAMAATVLAAVLSLAVALAVPLAEKDKRPSPSAPPAGSTSPAPALGAMDKQVAAAGESPKPEKVQPDYSTMLRPYAGAEDLRMPTKEEIEKLGSLWPKIPAEENAALIYTEADQELIRNCKEKLPEPPGSLSGDKSYDGDAQRFAHYIEANQRILEALQEGLAHPCIVPCMIELKSGSPVVCLPVLSHTRNLARFLADAGFAAELQGRPDLAAERYLECIRIGKQVRQNGPLITQLVGIAVQSIGGASLDHLIANASLDDGSLKHVIAVSRGMETTTQERLQLVRAAGAFAKAAISILHPKPGLSDALLQKDYDAGLEFILKDFEKPLPELIRSGESSAKEFAQEHPLHKALAPTLLMTVPQKLGRADIEMAVLQIHAAIALYQKQNGGRLPDTLDALCSEILPSMPIDPFSGKPMRYARTETGWKVWSVGPGNVDNGGVSHQTPEELRKGQVWKGPDYVFVSDLVSNLELRKSRGKPQTSPQNSENTGPPTAPAENPKDAQPGAADPAPTEKANGSAPAPPRPSEEVLKGHEPLDTLDRLAQRAQDNLTRLAEGRVDAFGRTVQYRDDGTAEPDKTFSAVLLFKDNRVRVDWKTGERSTSAIVTPEAYYEHTFNDREAYVRRPEEEVGMIRQLIALLPQRNDFLSGTVWLDKHTREGGNISLKAKETSVDGVDAWEIERVIAAYPKDLHRYRIAPDKGAAVLANELLHDFGSGLLLNARKTAELQPVRAVGGWYLARFVEEVYRPDGKPMERIEVLIGRCDFQLKVPESAFTWEGIGLPIGSNIVDMRSGQPKWEKYLGPAAGKEGAKGIEAAPAAAPTENPPTSQPSGSTAPVSPEKPASPGSPDKPASPTQAVIKSFRTEGERWILSAAEARFKEDGGLQLIAPVLEQRQPGPIGEKPLRAIRADEGFIQKNPPRRIRMTGHVSLEDASGRSLRADAVELNLDDTSMSVWTPDLSLSAPAPAEKMKEQLSEPPSKLYFVPLVVGKNQMTFEGEETTWDQLPKLLEKVPNRQQTVFELSMASDQLTVGEFYEADGQASALARHFGFKYLSNNGVHPLGSKGSPPKELPDKSKVGPDQSGHATPPPAPTEKPKESSANPQISQIGTDAAPKTISTSAAAPEGGPLAVRAAIEKIRELAAAPDHGGVEALIATLKDEREEVRQNAAQALGEIREARAVEPLIAALHDPSESVQEDAVRALGMIGDTRAVAPLLPLLNSPRKRLPLTVVTALGTIGHDGAIEALIATLKDERDYVREVAARTLGEIRDARAVQPLIAELNDPSESVQGEAVSALGVIGDIRALAPLFPLLKSPRAGLRVAAAEALGTVGDKRAIEPLVSALADDDLFVRGIAARSLMKLGWEPSTRNEKVRYLIAMDKWDEALAAGPSAKRVEGKANAVEGPLELGIPILLPLDICHKYPWLEFKDSEDGLKAEAHIRYASYPHTRWNLQLETVKADGGSITCSEVTFENSGTILGPGAIIQEDTTVPFALGRFSGMAQAKKFRFSLETIWTEQGNPFQFGEKIPLSLDLGAVEHSNMLRARWMKLEKVDRNVRATVHVEMLSWPKTTWRATLKLFDGSGETFAEKTQFENSGFIEGNPHVSQDDIRITLAGGWTRGRNALQEAKGYSLLIERTGYTSTEATQAQASGSAPAPMEKPKEAPQPTSFAPAAPGNKPTEVTPKPPDSPSWYVLRQPDTMGLLHGLPARLAESLLLSTRNTTQWKGIDDGGKIALDIFVEKNVQGEILVGFFADPRWWLAQPSQVRIFPQPGHYTVDRLRPGMYWIGAMIGTAWEPTALGVPRSWPEPVQVRKDQVDQVSLLVTPDFKNKPAGQPQGEMQKAFAGQVTPDQMDREHLVTVHTVDYEGRPVPYCQVIFREHTSGGGDFFTTGTDREGVGYCDKMTGAFSFQQLQHYDFDPGTLTQRAYTMRLEQVYNVRTNRNITIKWPQLRVGSAKLSGRVHDQLGHPLQKFNVTLTREEGEPTGSGFYCATQYDLPVIDQEGHFDVEGLPSGNYSVMVRGFDYEAYVWSWKMAEFTVPDQPNAVVPMEIEVEAKAQPNTSAAAPPEKPKESSGDPQNRLGGQVSQIVADAVKTTPPGRGLKSSRFSGMEFANEQASAKVKSGLQL